MTKQWTTKPIDRVSTIDQTDFIENYVKKNQPLVIENLTDSWPARHKWNFDYIRNIAGHKVVPLYNNEPVSSDKTVNQPDTKMAMAQYLDLLTTNQTDLRIFLYNFMKEVPALAQDFKYPELGLSFLKTLPMLFFGGQNVSVFMHYDIDYANILHAHFVGKKRCILVPPEQSKWMYKVPYSVICREDIDFNEPDFDKWPALTQLTPYITELNHGDVLYMPSGYWHHMTYLTPGFSMSLRAFAKKPHFWAKALINLTLVRKYDDWMRAWRGSRWIDEKNAQAVARTELLMKKHRPIEK